MKIEQLQKQVSVLQKILGPINIRRSENFNNLRTFQKKVIDMIDPFTSKKIGIIEDVCRLNKGYCLEFTAKDYAWWGTLNPDDCDVIPLNELQKKLTGRLRDIVDSLSPEDINLELAEEIIEAFKETEEQ